MTIGWKHFIQLRISPLNIYPYLMYMDYSEQFGTNTEGKQKMEGQRISCLGP